MTVGYGALLTWIKQVDSLWDIYSKGTVPSEYHMQYGEHYRRLRENQIVTEYADVFSK